MPVELLHRLVFGEVQMEIGVVLVTLQNTPALQKLRHAVADSMREYAQFVQRRCLDALMSVSTVV